MQNKYIVIDTWNGDGYSSDNGVEIKYFSSRAEAVEHAKKRRDEQLNLPYGLLIGAGNDGTGAITAIERILTGYPMKPIAEPVLVVGDLLASDLQKARDLGQSLAAGLSLGIF